jgi:hypothetical protein
MKSVTASAPLAQLMKVLSYQKGIGIEAMTTSSFLSPHRKSSRSSD